ncbi:hypothetical protein FNB15_09425 [Ferrovibrio terrae]|uniref:Uncharacterized protein n=1 Tax=Ferrovibrio terrae TaxID=2594003 RepID=A0A516H127_9PROT|nr:hypothetical protein [Ferrovibrio terrae]QDO97472.1 hypothetical protein FNB15_09425 [Ferrovibrio terrae]
MSEKPKIGSEWLKAQLDQVSKELDSWPQWMKDQARSIEVGSSGKLRDSSPHTDQPVRKKA